MTISERLFTLMKDKQISIRELSRRTGITASTISDWNTKGTNPSSDKLIAICEALEISPFLLLTGEEDKTEYDYILSSEEIKIIERYRQMDKNLQKRLLAYISNLDKKE
ncbi:MAG: helix-turn-helix domain-containing protein [Clostridia bacterium]|nr:helix-turn-helix domain-containing protein [Clostridia bacterium]